MDNNGKDNYLSNAEMSTNNKKKQNNSKPKSNSKTDKRAISLVADNKNGSLRSADYDELSTDYKPEPLDPEKYETFRRIASAEESEELDTFYNAPSDDGFDVSQEAGIDLSHMDPEKREQLQQEWRQELAKTEEEIQTLRQVLSSKLKHSHELKRKLGITVWKEFREDMEQGIKNIQETTAYAFDSELYKETSGKVLEWNNAIQTAPISGMGIFSTPAYQKTSEAVKNVGEKTTSVFGSLGGSVARKLGEVKNSNAFKSFEERVGSAVTNVKSKISTSRSNSTNSFEDALNSTERKSSIGATSPITSPTIPEDKPIS